MGSQAECNVDDHVLLPADKTTLADLNEDRAHVDSVPLRRGLRVAQERAVDTCVAEGEGFAVHQLEPWTAVLIGINKNYRTHSGIAVRNVDPADARRLGAAQVAAG